MVSSNGAVSAGAGAAGDLESILQAQELTVADLDANRAGRVSPKQLEILADRQKWGAFTVYGIIGVIVLLAGGLTAMDYSKKHNPAIFIYTGVMLGLALMVYMIYRAFRVPMPAEIADRKVTTVQGTIRGFLMAPNRGVYTISIDYVRYTGLSSKLIGFATGGAVKAYVIAERKLVLALEPVRP